MNKNVKLVLKPDPIGAVGNETGSLIQILSRTITIFLWANYKSTNLTLQNDFVSPKKLVPNSLTGYVSLSLY